MKISKSPRLRAALALSALVFASLNLEATTYFWDASSGNWNSASSWVPNSGPPGAGDNVIFSNAFLLNGSATPNNTVNVNYTVTGLTYSNALTSAQSNVTSIASGVTLSATGPVLIGGEYESTAYVTYAYMTGGGAFAASGSTFTVQNGGSASGANATAYLNLSGLSYFSYNNSAGTISVEDNAGSQTRLGGNVVLAGVSNYITAENINLGTSAAAQAGPAGTFTLGAGTNNINVANLNIGTEKNAYTVNNSGGGLRLRGVSGADTDRPPITIGNENPAGGTTPCTGSLLLNGCPVNVKASTLVVGANGYGGGSGDTGQATGVLYFDTGTIDATTVIIANSTSSTSLKAAGTVLVGASATLIVGTGGISMVDQGAASGTCVGLLDVATGGTVTASGNITNATAAGTSTINLGGTLDMAAGTTVGASGFPINNFTISNSANLELGYASSQSPIYVGSLTWPSTDSTLTVEITSLPPGVSAGSQYTLISASSIGGGSVTGNTPVTFPGLTGATGNLSQSGNSIMLNITAVPVPSVPQGLTATAGNAQVSLSWSASTGSEMPFTYNVARSTVSGEEVIIANVSTTSFVDTSVINGTTYYYEVDAENSGHLQSGFSSEMSAMPVGPPPAPSGLVASLEGGQMVLTWTDQDATSYNILRATSQGGPYTTIATGVTGTTYTDTTVSTGVSVYYYEVVGINTYGPGSASASEAAPYGNGNQLVNPGFENEPGTTGWTLYNNAIGNVSVETTNTSTTYDNSATGECPQDATAEYVQSHSGTNVGKLYGEFTSYPNHSGFQQELGAAPGSSWAAGAWTYASHEDLSGNNIFYYEVDFLNDTGGLLASYESYNVTDLTCHEAAPFPVDTWVYLTVTNQTEVSNGTNTGIVTNNTGSSGMMVAPAGTATVRFQALFDQTYDFGGSIYVDDCDLDFVSGPVPPTISDIVPDGTTLSTNTVLSCTAHSSANNLDLTNVIVISETTPFAGSTATTMTNNLGSPSLTVQGIGTTNVIIDFNLSANLSYNVDVIVTDANGVSSAASATFDTFSPTLVIEASDFNFSSGGFIDTTANGGLWLYANQVGSQGIDENKGSRTATKINYRPNDNVIIQAADITSMEEQKFVTAAASGNTNDVELEVGFNSPGDWLNYTRTYGPAGSAPAGAYNVWLYSATSGSGAQATLYQVAGDPTQAQQTTNLLGSFGNSAYVNTSYYNDEYLPLLDQFSNVVTAQLSGVQTLRSFVLGNPNLAFYMLTPSVTPSLAAVNPSGPFGGTNEFTFTIAPNNGAAIPESDIAVFINGINVTSSVTLNLVGGNWVGSYPLQLNSTYSAIIEATNSAGVSYYYSNSFDTFNANYYQWEAVDYDFSTNNGSAWISGLFIDDPVPTANTATLGSGDLAANSYWAYPTGFTPGADLQAGLGAIAQQGIDMNWADPQTGSNQWYRLDGVGSQPATDYIRPKFVAAQQQYGDPDIGPLNIGYFDAGNWLNYTRHYPTNSFYVYGRLAGGGGPFTNTTLSLVTSGVGTASQTTQVLGSFSDPNPAGWQVYHYIPLLDASSNKVVVSLGGLATLRLTSGAELNAEYFMLVPAPPQIIVAASIVSGHLVLSFPTLNGYNYLVLHSPSLSPQNWTQVGSTVTGNGSIQSVNESIAGTQGYFIIEAQQQ